MELKVTFNNTGFRRLTYFVNSDLLHWFRSHLGLNSQHDIVWSIFNLISISSLLRAAAVLFYVFNQRSVLQSYSVLWSITNVYFRVEESSSVLKSLYYASYHVLALGELHLQIEVKKGITKEKRKTVFLVPYLANTYQNTQEKKKKKIVKGAWVLLL